MSKIEEKKIESNVENQEKQNEDPFTNEVDESEPLDEESQKALNNINNFNFDSLTKPNDKHEKNKQKPSNKKSKTTKGVDFIEYAQKNGINVNIQYEENSANAQKKALNKKDNNFTTKPNTNTPGQFQKKGGKNKKFQKNYNTEGNNFHQNSYKLGSNKFDAFNSGFMMSGMCPPNLIRPEFNYPSYLTNNVNQDFQKLSFDDQNSDVTPDKKIIDSLEYYFSIENLNKDSFIRGKLDEYGFVNAEEIINFNQMKKNSVTIEKLKDLLKQFDTIIETKTEEEIIFLRNKNWDTIKDKLVPIEEILMQKKNKAYVQNNNYVHMQNNFYYHFNPYAHMPQPMEMNAFYQQQMMGYPNMQIPPGGFGHFPYSFQPQNPGANNNNF